uniref:Uncharacterized protein n=1 Tax=Anopheles dirus TaxID=7168 RepID=A0A182NCD2_9DIPT
MSVFVCALSVTCNPSEDPSARDKEEEVVVVRVQRTAMDPYGGGWPASPLRAGTGSGGVGGGMYDNISNDGIPMDALAELQDTGFEPQTRARSNTWPLPRPENFVEPETEPDSNKCSTQQLANTVELEL